MDFAKRDMKATLAQLSPSDRATVHDALVAKIKTLPPSVVARGLFGSGIGGAVAGGAASAVVGNLLGEIEKLFRRDFEFVR